MNNEKHLLNKLKNLSILYIEDEKGIREDMTSILELLCKEVYPYECANVAYKNFKTLQPDIIFSDITLGNSNGLEFAKSIRELDKKIPIILLSAHTDTDYLLKATKLKLVAYLTKPINFEELKSTLLEATKELSIEEDDSIFILNKNYTFDTLQRMLYDEKKQEIKMSANETKLLEYFIENKNRTLSQEEIKVQIWEDPYDATDAAFKSLIHKLRSKIGKTTLKNRSGLGYYLNLEN